MQSRRRRGLPVACLTWLAFATGTSNEGWAQQAGVPAIRRPASQNIGDRATAQANLIAADGERSRALADAKKKYAEAASLALANRSTAIDVQYKAVETYWEKKDLWRKEQWKQIEHSLEMQRTSMLKERALLATTWERAFSNPDAYRNAVRKGTFLNTMMNHLDGASGLSSSDSMLPSVVASLQTLDEKSLSALTLYVPSPGGHESVSLTSPLPTLFNRVPFLLRDPQFRTQRDAFLKATETLFAGGVDEDEAFDQERRCMDAMSRLTTSIYSVYPPDGRRKLSFKENTRLVDAERFLQEADHTIRRFAERHDSIDVGRNVYVKQYAPEQRNVATVCRFMLQNGVKFGPAAPGTEFIYDRLFIEMRKLSESLSVRPDEEWTMAALVDFDIDEFVIDEP